MTRFLRQASTSVKSRPLSGGCLWVADAVCGAVLADLRGDSGFLDTLRPGLTIIEIDID